ncbi:PulJ/GspJ family protein [Oceanithermus sp.]
MAKKGYTLVELLIVVAIAAVLFVAFFNSLVSSTKAHEKQSALSGAESDFESVLLSLETDAGRAGFLSTDPETVAWFAVNWPPSSPTLEVSHGTDFDHLTVRWAAGGMDCPAGAEYSTTLPSGKTGCIRKVEYYVDSGKLFRDLDEAGPVDISPFTVESFKVFFRDSNGTWSANMPSASEIRGVAAYLRVVAPYRGKMGCGTYPSDELMVPYGGAEAVGISTVTVSDCDDTLRLEQVVSSSLPNQQRY